MSPSPQQFLNAAAELWDVLVDLFRSQQSRPANEILELIARASRPTSQSQPTALLQRLKDYGFIESAPDAPDQYELARFVRDLVAHFLREQHITSAAVVQGFLNELSSLTDEIDLNLQLPNRTPARRTLGDVGAVLDRLRVDSRANREAVTSEALRLKANREGISALDRWHAVNRLMKHYLEPLRDLIAPKQAMDACLDRLQRVLDHGESVSTLDRNLNDEFRGAKARLERTRRTVIADHSESLREVTPLYESLRRDTVLLRGAGEALRQLRDGGLAALPIATLAISSWRSWSLISERQLENYVHAISEHTNSEPPPIDDSPPVTPPVTISREELLTEAQKAAPIEDLLQWLLNRYADASVSEALRAYGILLNVNVECLRLLGTEPKRYSIGRLELEAWPLKQATE